MTYLSDSLWITKHGLWIWRKQIFMTFRYIINSIQPDPHTTWKHWDQVTGTKLSIHWPMMLINLIFTTSKFHIFTSYKLLMQRDFLSETIGKHRQFDQVAMLNVANEYCAMPKAEEVTIVNFSVLKLNQSSTRLQDGNRGSIKASVFRMYQSRTCWVMMMFDNYC